jgi:hypothetical protein
MCIACRLIEYLPVVAFAASVDVLFVVVVVVVLLGIGVARIVVKQKAEECFEPRLLAVNSFLQI